MKSLIIKQASNGWIVNTTDNLYEHAIVGNDNTTHIFQTIQQLQSALPELLGERSNKLAEACAGPIEQHGKLTAEQCLESHKKAVEEFEAKAREQIVEPKHDPAT